MAAQINGTSKLTQQERNLRQTVKTKQTRVNGLRSDFDAVVGQTIPDYEELTTPQRSAALNTLANWSAATNAAKIDTTHAIQGLYGAVIDLLIDEITDLRRRVAELEK